jgi:hypothetical protein
VVVPPAQRVASTRLGAFLLFLAREGPLPVVCSGGWCRPVVPVVVRCWRASDDGVCIARAGSEDVIF